MEQSKDIGNEELEYWLGHRRTQYAMMTPKEIRDREIDFWRKRENNRKKPMHSTQVTGMFENS